MSHVAIENLFSHFVRDKKCALLWTDKSNLCCSLIRSHFDSLIARENFIYIEHFSKNKRASIIILNRLLLSFIAHIQCPKHNYFRMGQQPSHLLECWNLYSWTHYLALSDVQGSNRRIQSARRTVTSTKYQSLCPSAQQSKTTGWRILRFIQIKKSQ